MIDSNEKQKQHWEETEQLRIQIKDLQTKLYEAEEALNAIRGGEVDALVVYSDDDTRIYTLEGADHPYRQMMETINEGAATLQEDGTILYSNKHLAGMIGVLLEQLLGTSLQDYLLPEDRKSFAALVRKSLQGEGKAEFTIKNNSGARIPVLLSMTAVEIDFDRRICLIATDLTEHKQNIEIASAERMARSILEQAAEAIVVCDIHGIIIRASQAAYQILPENPLYQPFSKAFPIILEGAQKNRKRFSIDEVLAGKSFKGLAARLETHPGKDPIKGSSPLYILLSATPLRNDRGEILGCIVTFTDITQRRKAEAVLHEREMQHRLMDQREQERIQIARNLHDGPLQNIISLSYTIEAMQPGTQNIEMHNQLGEIRKSLTELAGELRSVCNELRPPILARFGLTRAIRAHADEFRSRYSNLALTLELIDDVRGLPDGIHMALFRIYQECLNNIIHHSGATEARVKLALEDNHIHLEIEDNGNGFNVPVDWVELVRTGHLGLVGMKERIEALGGEIQVTSRLKHGTRVWVYLPWAPGET